MKNLQFCTVLIKLRKQHGYTQQQVADALAISRQSYVGLESNFGDLSFTKMIQLSSMYGISVYILVDLILTENDCSEASQNDMHADIAQIKKLLQKYG